MFDVMSAAALRHLELQIFGVVGQMFGGLQREPAYLCSVNMHLHQNPPQRRRVGLL